MLAARWNGPGSLSLAELPEPHAGRGQVVVGVSACGICGSDLHTYHRGFLGRPGQVLGHEFAGTIIEADGADDLEVGQRVVVRPQLPCGACDACRADQPQLCEGGVDDLIGYGTDGAFAERVLVPRAVRGDTVFVLPDLVDYRGGALVEPLAVGLRAVRQAGDVAGRTVLVLGAGMIGLAATAFLRRDGVGTLIVADPSARRRAAAQALGADVTVDPAAQSTVEAVREITGPGPRGIGARADAIIDCAGAQSALGDALKAADNQATLVLCAMYARRVELRPDWITQKELTVRGSYAYRDEFAEALSVLASGALDPAAFVSHELPLAQIEEAFRIQSDAEASLKVLVRPAGS